MSTKGFWANCSSFTGFSKLKKMHNNGYNELHQRPMGQATSSHLLPRYRCSASLHPELRRLWGPLCLDPTVAGWRPTVKRRPSPTSATRPRVGRDGSEPPIYKRVGTWTKGRPFATRMGRSCSRTDTYVTVLSLVVSCYY